MNIMESSDKESEKSSDMVWRKGDADNVDVWDDSALIEAYDRAVSLTYEAVHESLKNDGVAIVGTSNAKLAQSLKAKSKKKKLKSKSKKWDVGDQCLARYSEDGGLYEAHIVDVDHNNGRVTVEYDGYEGEQETHDIDELIKCVLMSSNKSSKTGKTRQGGRRRRRCAATAGGDGSKRKQSRNRHYRTDTASTTRQTALLDMVPVQVQLKHQRCSLLKHDKSLRIRQQQQRLRPSDTTTTLSTARVRVKHQCGGAGINQWDTNSDTDSTIVHEQSSHSKQFRADDNAQEEQRGHDDDSAHMAATPPVFGGVPHSQLNQSFDGSGGLHFSMLPVLPPPPPPPLFAKLKHQRQQHTESTTREQTALSSMLMSWYMNGYHTGYYQAMQDMKSEAQKTSE